MFEILDGRTDFYQWDTDRKLIIKDENISQVHFCNKTGECSLVCDAYTENGKRLVDVPNILLQSDWRITVYAYDANYTKYCDTFKVIRRSKPTDYVYTETEVKTWERLEEQVGYYTPTVDTDGNLSWIASKSTMKQAETANIKGDKGDKGDTGDRGNAYFASFTVEKDGHIYLVGNEAIEGIKFSINEYGNMEVEYFA